jgi:hypothetical protein
MNEWGRGVAGSRSSPNSYELTTLVSRGCPIVAERS